MEILVTAWALAVILIVLQQVGSIEKRVAALSRVDAKLDLLLRQAGIEYAPFGNLPLQVTEALQCGEKIRAIKLYRESTGVGLKEAKEFIEEIQRRGEGGPRDPGGR